MKRLTYTVHIHPCEPDEGGYWVEVPTLPGCVTQGESYQEALDHAREAIEGYVETLIQLGKPVPIEENQPETVAVEVLSESVTAA